MSSVIFFFHVIAPKYKNVKDFLKSTNLVVINIPRGRSDFKLYILHLSGEEYLIT